MIHTLSCRFYFGGISRHQTAPHRSWAVGVSFYDKCCCPDGKAVECQAESLIKVDGQRSADALFK